jgi:hypothetical protein
MLSCSMIIRRSPQIKTWHGFVLLLLCEWALLWYCNSEIFTLDVYHNLYGDHLEPQRIDDLFDIIKRLSVWGYVAIPIIAWLRIAFVTLLLQMPLVFRFIDIPFRDIFRIVLKSSFLLLLLELMKLLYLSRLSVSALSQAELAYLPLSLTNWLNTTHFSASATSFLNHLNLFEIGWLVSMYWGLAKTGKLKKLDAGVIVLVLWTALIVLQWSILIYLEKMNTQF